MAPIDINLVFPFVIVAEKELSLFKRNILITPVDEEPDVASITAHACFTKGLIIDRHTKSFA